MRASARITHTRAHTRWLNAAYKREITLSSALPSLRSNAVSNFLNSLISMRIMKKKEKEKNEDADTRN